jgi:hypothetical protein
MIFRNLINNTSYNLVVTNTYGIIMNTEVTIGITQVNLSVNRQFYFSVKMWYDSPIERMIGSSSGRLLNEIDNARSRGVRDIVFDVVIDESFEVRYIII